MALRRRAFSRLEVLVFLALAAVAASVVLPAVQAASEDARAAGCRENLRRIGEAFQKHRDAHGAFPPCRTTSPVRYGVGVNLLPFLELGRLYEAYRFDKNFYDQENEAISKTPVALNQCPEPNRIVRMREPAIGPLYGTEGIAGDYFTNHALSSGNAAGAARRNPALLQSQMQPASAISDGTACTLIMVEQAGREDHWVLRAKQRNYKKSVHPGFWGAGTSFQTFTYTGYSADGTTPGLDCSMNCNNAQGMYSFHATGSNAAFCDGSVRFLSARMPVELVLALATRDGGELVDLRDF